MIANHSTRGVIDTNSPLCLAACIMTSTTLYPSLTPAPHRVLLYDKEQRQLHTSSVTYAHNSLIQGLLWITRIYNQTEETQVNLL